MPAPFLCFPKPCSSFILSGCQCLRLRGRLGKNHVLAFFRLNPAASTYLSWNWLSHAHAYSLTHQGGPAECWLFLFDVILYALSRITGNTSVQSFLPGSIKATSKQRSGLPIALVMDEFGSQARRSGKLYSRNAMQAIGKAQCGF